MSGSATAATDVTAPDWRQWLTEQFGRLDKWFEGRLAAGVGPDDEVVTAEALLDGDRLERVLTDMAGRHEYADDVSAPNAEAARLLETIGTGEDRALSVAAALLTGSYAGPLTTVAVTGLAAGVGFDLSPRQCAMVLVDGTPRRLLLDAPGTPPALLAVLDGVTAPAGVRRVNSGTELRALVWRSLYGDHLWPLFDRVGALTRAPAALMWTNAAEWLANIHESALEYVGGQAASALVAECRALLAAESLPGVDDRSNPLRGKIEWVEVTTGAGRYEVQTREVCTLAYLLAKRSGRMCGTCPYLKPEERIPLAHELHLAPFETRSTTVTMGTASGTAMWRALGERLRSRRRPANQ